MKYQYIVNPVTNRKCRVDSLLGKKIINNYIQLGGGMKMKDFPNTYKFIRIVLGNNPNVHRDAEIRPDEVHIWERAEGQISGENKGDPKYNKEEINRYKRAVRKGFQAGQTINDYAVNMSDIDKQMLKEKFNSSHGEDIPIPKDHKDSIIRIINNL